MISAAQEKKSGGFPVDSRGVQGFSGESRGNPAEFLDSVESRGKLGGFTRDSTVHPPAKFSIFSALEFLRKCLVNFCDKASR